MGDVAVPSASSSTAPASKPHATVAAGTSPAASSRGPKADAMPAKSAKSAKLEEIIPEDAPAEHESHIKVRYQKTSSLCRFQAGGIWMQTTVQAAQFSIPAACASADCAI